MRTGKRVPRQVVNAETGEIVEVLEPVKCETALVRLALQRWDARYTGKMPAEGDTTAANTLDATVR